MANSDFKKIHSEKRDKIRDLNDVRTRASKRLKETRKSNRQAALNLHRHVEVIPEVRNKKTEIEEKLSRLRAFKNEKLKRMEEQKKNQKPPFYSLVRARHTGGTPFRATQPLKKPVISFPPATRSRTAFQKEFEFKATLATKNHNGIKEQKILFPTKSVSKNTSRSKENQSVKPNLKILQKEPLPRNGIRKKPVVLAKLAEGKSTHNKENFSEKAKLCSTENKIDDASEILNIRLNERVFIMSPLLNCNTVRRSARNRPRPSAGSDLINVGKSKNEVKEVVEINSERNIVHHEEVDHNGPEILRKKLNEETDRLGKIADCWFASQKENSIPEHIKDEILAVVGQTRLLLSDKFQQFRSLIDNAQSNITATVVKYDDLLGFWEMMYLEVEQLNRKYKNLDDLKNRKWLPVEVGHAGNNKKKKIIPKKTVRPTSSKFRDFLKKKKEDENSDKKEEEIQILGTPLRKTVCLIRTSETGHRTRRSSASSITLKKSFLAKAVLSPYSKL